MSKYRTATVGGQSASKQRSWPPGSVAGLCSLPLRDNPHLPIQVLTIPRPLFSASRSSLAEGRTLSIISEATQATSLNNCESQRTLCRDALDRLEEEEEEEEEDEKGPRFLRFLEDTPIVERKDARAERQRPEDDWSFREKVCALLPDAAPRPREQRSIPRHVSLPRGIWKKVPSCWAPGSGSDWGTPGGPPFRPSH